MTEDPRSDTANTDTMTMGDILNQAMKLKQKVEVSPIGPCKKHIKVTIERSEIDARMNAKFNEMGNDAQIPGFRPGKAPRKLVMRRFEKDVLKQVKAEMLLESLEQLAEENDIAPLSPPSIDPFALEVPKDSPFIYEFDVEVRPDFTMPEYKGLHLNRPVKEFTDKDVKEEARRQLAPFGQVVPKANPRTELGDVIIADIESKDGTRALSNIADLQVRVEPQLTFKDGVAKRFGEEIVGAKPGDQRQVVISLSARSADATLAGKEVQATFHVKEVKTLQLPDLTHEFLHNFGVHNEAQFEELLRGVLASRLEYLQRQSARQQIMAKFDEVVNLDLPRDLLERQARRALGRRVMEMRSQGISDSEINSRIRELEVDVVRTTASSLKEHFVLQKIAELEKIDINEDDLETEIERIAERNNESPRRLRARIEREDYMDALAAEIIERRALDLIFETAIYNDVPLGKDEEGSGSVVLDQQAVPGDMIELASDKPEVTAEPGSSQNLRPE